MVNKKLPKVFMGVVSIFLLYTPLVQAQSPRLNGDSAREHLERAQSYESSGDPRAEQEYRRAIAARGGVYAEAWEELSEYLAENQRFDEAANAFRKYLKQARHKGRRLNLARLHRLDRAAELKSRSERGDSLTVAEMVELVRLVEGSGSRRDAVPYAEQTVRLYPGSAEALIVLAKVLGPEEKERALQLLNQAVAFEPNDPTIYATRGWHYYWAIGNSSQAEADFRRAIEISKGSNASAWAGLGDALAGQRRRYEAIAAYRKYLSIRPKSAAHYDGEVKKSIEKLQSNPSQQ